MDYLLHLAVALYLLRLLPQHSLAVPHLIITPEIAAWGWLLIGGSWASWTVRLSANRV